MTDFNDVIGAGDRDGPPSGVKAWKSQTKAIERVIEVALTLEQPRTADWISDEAAVAEQTARDHLGSLSSLGVVTETTARGVTKYQLDLAYKRFKEVSSYVEQFEKDALMDLVGEVQSDIEATRERYDVASPAKLRAKAVQSGTSSAQVQEYKKAASEWESLEHTLDVLQEALERYDEFSRHEVPAS